MGNFINFLFAAGFTNYMRSPAADIFNPDHYSMNQDMNQPLCNYFIASSHNTYLTGDQLMSQSRVDMYAWVLQAGCRCVEGQRLGSRWLSVNRLYSVINLNQNILHHLTTFSCLNVNFKIWIMSEEQLMNVN